MLIIAAVYFVWQNIFNKQPVEPLYEEPYVIVYVGYTKLIGIARGKSSGRGLLASPSIFFSLP